MILQEVGINTVYVNFLQNLFIKQICLLNSL